MDYFKGRTVAIGTMHGKESVMEPLLREGLSLWPVVAHFDTDELGTFSGEKERFHSAYDAAKLKCLKAMELADCDLAIASEGSFGPHPSLLFSSADEELILLVDRKNDCEWFGKALSTNTNFSGSEVGSMEEAIQFCNKIGFPEHAVILKHGKDDIKGLVKGIQSLEELEKSFLEIMKSNGSAWIETDMRAMFNPTRMKVIEQATQNLIEKISSKCPKCNFPGYWIVDMIEGLPCSDCGFPTRSINSHKYGCMSCDHSELKDFPYSKEFEDPMYCDFCNP